VHLLGNSLGGAVTTRVAALRPDLVRTLTLVSPALPEILVQRSAVPTALLALPGAAGLFTRATRKWSAEARVRGVLALCYGDPGLVSPEGFRNAVEEMERRLQLPYLWDAMTRSARGIVNAYTLGGQHGLWRQAERVLAPTLLVYGGRDQLVGFRMARKAARAFRDSRLLTLPEAGHVAMMEYPATVARAFRELLAETGELGGTGTPGAGESGGTPGAGRSGGTRGAGESGGTSANGPGGTRGPGGPSKTRGAGESGGPGRGGDSGGTGESGGTGRGGDSDGTGESGWAGKVGESGRTGESSGTDRVGDSGRVGEPDGGAPLSADRASLDGGDAFADDGEGAAESTGS
jgi:hypothetical protein